MKRFIYTLACLVLSIGAWAQGEVAQIGETKYATLADAVAAVPTDGTETTITMLEDVDLGTAYITIPATKNVVLELNGKTITSSAKSYGTIRPAGRVIINGEGTVQSTTKYAIQTTANTADVVLNGATLESTTNSAVSASKGTFTMNSGTVSASSHAIEGGAVIKGGTVTSTNGYGVYANSSSAECVIEGGSITGAASKGAVGVYSGNVKVTSEPTLSTKIVFTDNATGLILPETAAAHIDNATANLAIYDDETLLGYATAYTTGTIASGKTVKVIADINTSNYMNIAAIKLDLNGHNITSTAQAAIVIQGSSVALTRNVTITGEGNVSCSNASGCNAVQIGKHANVTIEGGNYSVPGDNATIYIASSVNTNPTTVNITGGSYHSGDGKWILNIKDAAATAGAKINVTGGKFYNFDPANNTVDGNSDGNGTNYVPDNYVTSFTMDGSDKVYEVSEGTWVAKIEGGVGSQFRFATLAEAISAVPDGVETTITLLANTTENITIPAGKNIILDLNGKTLNGGSVASNGKKAAILNYGSVVIKDSSVEQTGIIKRDDPENYDQSNSYYVIDNQGTMTIKSGTITNNAGLTTAHKGSSLIRNGEVIEGAVLNIEGGTLTQKNFDVIKNGGNNSVLNITGGTINSANSYAILSYDEVNMSAGSVTGKVCLRSYDDDNAVANISGGTINGNITVETYPGNTPTNLSECNISGDAIINGTLSVGEGNGNTFTANDDKGTIAVSGGTFANSVPEQYCADGFIPVKNSEGVYGVKVGTFVARIGETGYESLSAAIAAATADATITLIADINESVTNSNANSFTIDLNGSTWTSDATSTFKNDGGIVTITDTDASGKGTVQNTANESDKGIAVWARTGSVVIKNGTFVSQSNYEATLYVGTSATYLGDKTPKITVDGGTIKNEAEGKYAHNSALLPLTLNIINNIANADAYQAIVVNGGTFFGNDPSVGDDSQLNKINNNSNFVNSEKHAEYKDGVFTIEEGGYKAQTGYIKYVTLDAAIDAAPESATSITLLADAETTKETLPANVTIDANSKVLTMPSFVVLDGQAFTLPNIINAETYKVHTATYIRTNISATEWGTVCLPFSLTSGNGANYYTYNNISGSTLTVDEVTSVDPNTPVVFHKGAGDLTINETDATVSLVTPGTLENGALVGTYTSSSIDADGNIYFINSDTFHKAQVSLTVPAYRAYINYTAPTTEAAPRTLFIVVSGDESTAIGTLETADAAVSAIYDATGRKISAPQKGINIMKLENGKTVKVMIK